MPRLKPIGKGRASPITLRLPEDEEAFYRRKSKEAGLTLNAYLSKLLVEGVIAEKAHEFEDRVQRLIASVPTEMKATGGGVSDDLALSVFTCEALLTAIVEAQDQKTLYAAQDAAKARMRKRKGV